jgi:hypothetical protein
MRALCRIVLDWKIFESFKVRQLAAKHVRLWILRLSMDARLRRKVLDFSPSNPIYRT